MREVWRLRQEGSTSATTTSGPPTIVVVMGVSGSGKSTIGALLAGALCARFQEGDDLHPAKNIEKMHGGEPLTDEDRIPWLKKIAEVIDAWRADHQSGVITCSALKRTYRDMIIGDRQDVTLIYLKGSPDLIHRRMLARHGHFMPVELLESQFASLEEPMPDEHAIIVDIAASAEHNVEEIMHRLESRMPAK